MAKKPDPKKTHNASVRRRRVRGINSDLESLTIRGEKFKAALIDAVTAARLVRTLEGASTINIDIHDPDMRSLAKELLAEKSDVKLDGLFFRLVGVSKGADTIGLGFEDREVALLRELKGPKKATRGDVTRAEFILSLVLEVRPKIEYFIKELHKDQPIATAAASNGGVSVPSGSSAVATSVGTGSLDSSGLTVKGSPMTQEQADVAQTVLSTLASLGASQTVMVANIMLGIQENVLTNQTGGDALNPSLNSACYYQITDGSGYSGDKCDLVATTEHWYNTGYWIHGGAKEVEATGASPQMIAQNTQGSISYDGALYGQWGNEAEAIVGAFSGGGIAVSSGAGVPTTSTETKPYSFEVKPNESYWDAIQRLAEEVQWRAFMSAGVFYYAAEEDLYRGPIMIQVKGRNTHGVDDVDFDYDVGKKITEISIACRTKEWAAPPGTVIELGEAYGPAAGLYLVSQIDTSLFDETATVTAKRPTRSLPEPAPETVETTSVVGDPGVSVGGTVGLGSDSGTATFEGEPVCAKFIPILEEARRRGWSGTVTSGVRTESESIAACYDICGAPTCAGTCAGTASNHNGCDPGAIDVSDETTFASIMEEMGNPIFNNLPEDLIHFSETGQ